MTERLLVLHSDDPVSFVADACAALAAAVNEPHVWTLADPALVATYAAMVRAYTELLRPRIDHEVKRAVVDHLLDRLGQAQRGEFPTPIVDIVDRLHGELLSVPVLG